MAEGSNFLTVYRSADSDARDEAEAIYDLLSSAGIEAVLLDDSSPGIFTGTYEVRVPPDRSAEAEQLIAASARGEVGAADPSHHLDLETVFSAEGTTAEMEALAIKSILEANFINAVLVGTTTLPNLRFEVRVPREHAEAANRAIEEARAAGPEAAEAAERESEGTAT